MGEPANKFDQELRLYHCYKSAEWLLEAEYENKLLIGAVKRPPAERDRPLHHIAGGGSTAAVVALGLLFEDCRDCHYQLQLTWEFCLTKPEKFISTTFPMKFL